MREAGAPMIADARQTAFYGWRVVGAAFVLAVFGWGVGFFGPPVFLSVIRDTRGWPLALVSTAVSLHFLVGAVVGAKLPALHGRFGAPAVTKAGAVAMAAGIVGWAMAMEPWQLFAATVLTGLGWSAMSAAAVNALVSPWFVRARPMALGMAYNGGSLGGVVFSPLWVAAIGAVGFPLAAAAVGAVMAVTLWLLADRVFSRTPEALGQLPDGEAAGAPTPSVTSAAARPLPGALLRRDAGFLTLAAGMALGLFAQIGLVAHLFSLLVPALGPQRAGLAMGLVTALAVAGRTALGWLMPLGADRRLLACLGYALQLAGSIALIAAAGTSVPLLLVGVVLFGAGFGNATSLPPLIAQVEFVERDVARVVSLIVGISQGGYAFAPAVFGLIRAFTADADAAAGAAPAVFAAAALVQGMAIGAFLLGRRRSRVRSRSAIT
jgi:MFS family permease